MREADDAIMSIGTAIRDAEIFHTIELLRYYFGATCHRSAVAVRKDCKQILSD
jgi:hypothetical protein